MRFLLSIMFILLVFIGCTNENEDEVSQNGLTEQALLGTWSWQIAQVTDAANQQSGTLKIGDENCNEFNVMETAFCDEAESKIVEECRTFQAFEIRFEETKTYDRIEHYRNTNVQIDISNNCRTILHDRDKNDSFYSGSWAIENGAIILNETYRKSERIFYSENRTDERFETSLFTWQVLAFTAREITVFWRTPDQIDYEITLVKK